MSERTQHICVIMQDQMSHRYGDEYLHKHDKRHTNYRRHWKTHPVTTQPKQEQPDGKRFSENLLRTKGKRKIWKRLAKISFH